MYKIFRTDKAEEQLYSLVNYIADSVSVEMALNYLDKIESAIKQLAEFPNIGVTPRYTAIKKQGYKVLIVEKHLIFYKINDITNEIMIYAIFDGRQEYKNLI